MKWFLIFSFLAAVLLLGGHQGAADGARILAIYPSFIKSHFRVAEKILDELLERGHEVTLLSPFSFTNRRDHVDRKTEIQLEGLAKYFEENGISDTFTVHTSAVEDAANVIYATAEVVNYTMGHEAVQKLLEERRHFDLVMMDQFLSDAFLGFGHIYNAPVVMTTSSALNKWTNKCTGNPNNPAFNPHPFLAYTDRMSFWQRMLNAVVTTFEDLSYELLYLPTQEALYQRFFAKWTPVGRPLPPLNDLIHNVSLVLANSNPVFHGARAIVPKILEVGGIHIRPPQKPLPQDVRRYFSISDGGVYLMVLGAVTKTASVLPQEKWSIFNEVFRRRPTVGVFVKWEERVMENQATNVVIGRQIPQEDMLADPKVRLLITSGGLMTIYEAIYYKKPMIVMPMAGDQFQNVALVQRHGIGRLLNFDNITTEAVVDALDDVLTNPAYLANLERLHQLMFVNDPGRNKLGLAIDNIEFVLATGGAGHLRSPAVELSQAQLYLLDVMLVLLVIVVTILAVPSVIIGVILRKTNAKSNEMAPPTSKDNNNNKSNSNRGNGKKTN